MPDVQERIAVALERIADGFDILERIADVIAPSPTETVGTPYVAQKLGCTTVWVAEMVRKGQIPKSCLVAGTGVGKPWKFYRKQIESWLETR
jgi:predicted DNA-binding transcriptional regulator AlpA